MKRVNTVLLLSIILGLVSLVGYNSVFVVNEMQQALILQFGKVVNKDIINAGLHYKIPFVQEVVYFDKRILHVQSEPREVIASDQKRLIVDTYSKYKIIDPLRFYQSVRSEFGLISRISPIIESGAREEIARVTLNCLLSDCRPSVMDNIRKSVTEKADRFGIVVIDVRVKNTTLPKENSYAIFNRMQTDREKEAKEIRARGAEESYSIKSAADRDRRLILAEANKKSKIIMGEADAKAADVYSEAFSVDKDFFEFYRYMQFYKNSLLANNSKIVVNSDSEYLKFLFKGLNHEK